MRWLSIAMTRAPDVAVHVPAVLEALLGVFAPLDVTVQIDEPLRVARLDPARAFAGEPLWCDEELTRDALTRCSPALGADVIAELHALAPSTRVTARAFGALRHHAGGDAAWYGRWRHAILAPLAIVEIVWTEKERVVRMIFPNDGYPLTPVRPLVRGELGPGDPALATANREAIVPVILGVREALGLARDEVRWDTQGDYASAFRDDRAALWSLLR